MTDNETTSQDVTVQGEGAGSDPRQRSTIQFPYADLADVEDVALAIHSNVGGGGCDDAQLGPWLGLSAKSSGFRVRISAARMFGLVETRDGAHFLTDLGKAIVDPMRQRAARVTAFINVPLFTKVFEDHKGGVLPPPAALERAMEGFGVAPKQKSRARQILERSADQAGFFDQGKNRLVKPGIAAPAGTPAKDPAPDKDERGQERRTGGSGGGGDQPPLDDLIRALVARIPRSETWPADKRLAWLRAAVTFFDLVYGAEDEIEIGIART